MEVLLVCILAVVQGLTEFLPVSSSGHLVLARALLGPYLGTLEFPLAFDVLVHLATALVTAFFLRAELKQILLRMFQAQGSDERRLCSAIVLATVPAAIVGLFFEDAIKSLFASASWAFNGFLITAGLLAIGHSCQVRFAQHSTKQAATLDWPIPTYFQAVCIGCAQALAIMPGVSRSGSTIAVALLLGLPGRSAVLFSFFILLPVVAGGAVLEIPELLHLSVGKVWPLFLAFLLTMVTAYVALKFLVWVVEGAKLHWFALYAVLLGTFGRFLV